MSAVYRSVSLIATGLGPTQVIYSRPLERIVVNEIHQPGPDEKTDSAAPLPRFSPVITVLSSLILLAGVIFFVWLQVTVPYLARVSAPERSLALVVSHTMDLEHALRDAPPWKRVLFEVLEGGANELAQVTGWYRELADYSADPLVQVYFIILEAEGRQLDSVRRQVEAWERKRDPFPTFARFLRAGYLEPEPDSSTALTLQAELAEMLPASWFYHRLAINIAARTRDDTLRSVAERALAERAGRLLERSWAFLWAWLVVMLLGTVSAIVLFIQRRRSSFLAVNGASLPPPWRGRVGVLVLVRGGALGILLAFGLIFVGVGDPLVGALTIPVASLPLLILAHRHLLRPAGLGFRRGLGLWPTLAGWRRVSVVVPFLLAAGMVGEWGIAVAAEAADLSSHWTEWFIEKLTWGPPSVLAVSLVEIVVFAPIFEEIVFRGLLFATLRRKFGWIASAGLSGAIFAVMHGYGALGMLSVFWNGLLWAWAYEKTGSLLPGITAHALNNLAVCAALLVVFR